MSLKAEWGDGPAFGGHPRGSIGGTYIESMSVFSYLFPSICLYLKRNYVYYNQRTEILLSHILSVMQTEKLM